MSTDREQQFELVKAKLQAWVDLRKEDKPQAWPADVMACFDPSYRGWPSPEGDWDPWFAAFEAIYDEWYSRHVNSF